MILDLFAGPGGWSEAVQALGLREVGLEWDAAACRTRAAAGHTTIRCDVSKYPTEPFIGKTRGVGGSPPCTKFSAAGKGFGRLVLDILADGIRRMMHGDDCREEIRELLYPIALAEQEKANEKRKPEKRRTRTKMEAAARDDAFVTVLVLEPARYLHALITADSPQVPLEWAALEQVREVLPLWQVYAAELRRLGWSVWCGILNSADYGVPQTRKRAILIASRIRVVTAPAPTHTQYPGEDLFGESLPGWVSMADALDLVTGLMVNTRGERKTPGGNEFSVDGPSWCLTEKTRSWVLRHNSADRDRPRDPGTGRLMTRSIDGESDYYLRFAASSPSPVITTHTARWAWERPANDRIADKRPIMQAEAAVLQSFRADYPWQGTKTKQFEQIGNAVPPLLAAHVVAEAAGVSLPAVLAGEAA